MPDVEKFVLDGTTIDVKDAIARAEASSASSNVASLTQRVNAIEQMSRLTVSYTQNTSTITFTTTQH